MKDKRKDQSLIEAYNNLMNLMLHDFPANRIHEIVAEDVTGYGTTGDEKIIDIAGLKKVVNDQRTQGRDKEIQFNVTPVKRKKMASGNAALFVDEIALTLPINGASKEIPIRLSSLFEYVDGAWKVVYLQGSVAESTDEDTWNMNEWREKNAELQKLLDEKTAELARQNRELEIEAALERVRSRSMGMQKSEDLRGVVRVLYAQLKELGFQKGVAAINIMDYDSGDIDTWSEGFVDGYDLPENYHVPYFEHSGYRELIIHWKSGTPYATVEIAGLEKKSLDNHYFFHTDFVKVPETTKQLMMQQESVLFSMAYMRYGALTWTPSPISDEQANILQRFARVFEQTYTRFLDLQKAEAQAKEAQIEAALERVRAKAMAMYGTSDISEATAIVFNELSRLRISMERCGIGIWKEPCILEIWSTTLSPKDKQVVDIITGSVNAEIHPMLAEGYRAWKNKNDFFSYELNGIEVKEYYELLERQPGYHFPKVSNYASRQILNTFNFDEGYIFVYTNSPLLSEEKTIIQRFSNVFALTYRRYQDLIKAEAQAREAQIQLALERVRARTMAMQKSDELREVVSVIYDQLQQLGFTTGACNILIMQENSGNVDWWMSGFGTLQYPESFHVNYFNHPAHIAQLSAWKRGEKFTTIEVSGKAKKEFDEIMLNQTGFKKLPGEIKAVIKSLEKVIFSMAFMKYGALAWATTAITDEHANVLQRFAKVFEQTYTRFLDLQKAEAQAREARIEAALERIRSRTMAMHKSDELKDVVVVVFEKLKDLGLTFEDAGIQLYREGSKDIVQWVAAPDLVSAPVLANLPYAERDHKESELIRDIWAAKENGKSIHNKNYSFDEKNKFFEYAGRNNDLTQIPADVREFQMKAPGYTQTLVAEKHSALWVDSYSGQTISVEEFNVLKRFARVFEQAYTRFLDLQKSEAQTREAQIQLALERVRARTMAMHHSSELADAATILFDQLKQLDAELWTCGFAICDRHKDVVEKWMTSPSGQIIDQPLLFPISHPEEKAMYEAWKNGVELTTTILGEEDLRKSFENLTTLPFMKKLMNDFVESGVTLPTWTQGCVVNFTHGYLLIITTRPFEETPIFTRFAKVFEQTYTRFLDLQKAEAQAREAQIEAALERVRARTMGLQKSEDLRDVVKILYTQLIELGFKWGAAAISIIDSVSGDIDWWMEGFDSGYDLPEKYHVPYFDHRAHREQIMHWKSGTPYAVVEISGQDKKSYDSYYFFHTDFVRVPESTKQLMMQQEAVLFSFAYMQYGALFWSPKALTEEQAKILQRFAKVFEQTYTRFLDLQKAEAQAREAQIEAALEKVRGMAMGMHNSSDLSQTVNTFFKELKTLGIVPIRCGVGEMHEATKTSELVFTTADKQGELFELPGKLFHEGHPIVEAIFNHWQKQEEYHPILDGEEMSAYYKVIRSQMELPPYADFTRHFGNYFYFRDGFFFTWGDKPLNEEGLSICRRFTSVLSLTYKRYKELHQTEAQAREAQIQLALERVRARTMAMHSSSELIETAELLFDQMKQLGAESAGVAFAICEPDNIMVKKWTSIGVFSVPYTFESGEQSMYEAWKNQTEIYEVVYEGEKLKKYLELFMEIPEFKTGFQKFLGSDRPFLTWQKNHAITFKYGYLLLITNKPFEETNIFIRFAKVFEQTYTRFLDLQKAEAQAREAQIEAALEKIRSRSLAMHNSQELREVIAVFFERLNELEVLLGTVGIALFDLKTKHLIYWVGNSIQDPQLIKVPYNEAMMADENFVRDGWNAMVEKTELINKFYPKAQKDKYFEYLFSNNDMTQIPESAREILRKMDSHIVCFIPNNHSALFADSWDGRQYTDDGLNILRRAGKVFEQAYIRFLDLQKAEAQAREAQIEAALERVRSRSMAMHRSEELSDVILTVSVQLQELGFRFDNVSFVLNTEAEDYDFWFSIPGQPRPHHIHVPYIDNPINNRAREARSMGLKFFADIIDPSESRAWHQHMFNHNQMDFLSAEAKAIVLKSGYARSVAIMHSIMLVVGNYASKPYREEDNSIIRRFATVFEQTYTRFLDLKKVEGQAKEAQIETALEKVRSRSLAMHRSEELEQVVASLFDRLVELGFSFNGALIFTFDKERRNIRLWIATTHLSSPVLIDLPFDEEIKNNAIIKALWNAIENGEHIFNKSYTGETKNEYFRYVARYNESKVPESVRKIQLEAESWTAYFVAEKNSIVGFDNWSGPITTITDSDFQILLRFAKVFDQAYIRFLDLQKAEAREREAIKQASLDRVRAEIASMRTAADLNRITPLVWRELTTLGVPFFRCGVFIVDNEAKKIDSYLSNPEGESLAAWRSDYDTIPLFTESVKAWEKQQVYITEWNEQQFIEFSQRLVGQGLIRDVKRYQAGEVAPEHLSLHMIPFRQGMLYVGSAEKLNNDQIELAQALASSFSVAYSRYEDFRQLEKAKSEVEYTLSELKSTQTQLIHAEKMASLGELTAGIAHEIQNPLNFVNNFSEVSKEMIEELKAERLKVNAERDEGLEEELLNDINENLQKIHHHGQRASGIVKGMLQHSRTSSGQKEPTNINSLADEYLRLAYHGFRAKDKTFNANFKTDLDPSLPNVKVVGQDIGRVLLNLINNAFYAVSAKSKRGVDAYEPTVTVRTKRINHSIEITVKDNGDGIPTNVINKIFQPFFTTKPTGEGTGLGLSLSYDIITKGHNGSLEVDTTEGVGTEFIVQLPVV